MTLDLVASRNISPLHTTEQLSDSSSVTFLMPYLKGKLGSFVSMIIIICKLHADFHHFSFNKRS